MRKSMKFLAVFLLGAVILSACNMPVGGNATPTLGAGGVQTAAAMTVQALQTQIAAATPVPQDTQAPEPTQAVPTKAALPTAAVFTAVPSLTPQGQSPTGQAAVCDKVTFVDDVTIPDGTNIGAGKSFTKTWRLKNSGTCSWTSEYKLVFASGDAMGAPASVALPGAVSPNQTVDVSVTMTAPNSSKTYQGNWKLQNAKGQIFGLGSKGDQPFWVKIVVGSTQGPSYFAVTGAQLSADPATYTGSCPFTLKLSAKLTVSTGGIVSYYWERSDGGTNDQKSVEFDKAGTKTITTEIEGVGFDGYTFDGSYRLYVDVPNHQYFGPVKVKITCNP